MSNRDEITPLQQEAWATYANLANIAKNKPVSVRGMSFAAGIWNKQYRQRAARILPRAYARFKRRKGYA